MTTRWSRVAFWALTVLAACAVAPRAEAQEVPELTLAVGSPFVGLEGVLPVIGPLAVEARAALVEAHAVRGGVGLRATARLGGWGRLSTEVLGLRAAGLDVASTWDAELAEVLEVRWDVVRLVGRAGVVGYLGREPSQRGVVGLGSLRVLLDVDAAWRIGIEYGVLGDRFVQRPLAGVVVAWAP